MKFTLATDHSQSSYGFPVLVIDGIAYGPADLVPTGDIQLPAANIVADAAIAGRFDNDPDMFALAGKFIRAYPPFD